MNILRDDNGEIIVDGFVLSFENLEKRENIEIDREINPLEKFIQEVNFSG